MKDLTNKVVLIFIFIFLRRSCTKLFTQEYWRKREIAKLHC